MGSLASTGNDTPGQLVWYITGTSSGLGRRLVPILLERGDKVVATARAPDTLRDAFPASANLRVQQLDVTAGAAAIRAKAEAAIAFFGRVDVVVNNAGAGWKAIIEEAGSAELRKQFDVNFFGLVDVTTAFLPHMRARRSGTIVFVGSRTSWSPENPTTGLYAASKAAVRVLSETLAAELAPFAIRVLTLEPGAFRTERIFARPLFLPPRPIPDYAPARAAMAARYAAAAGRQPGDPAKAMRVLVDVVRGEGVARGRAWTGWLPLGAEAEESVRGKVEGVLGVLEEWGEVVRDVRLDEV